MYKIAVIGGGVVGSSCAFYLSKMGHTVDLFDINEFQGTSAAVGIICPWVNQRRSKVWYELVRSGAEFYDNLLEDLKVTNFYQRNGTIIVNEKQHKKLWEIANERLGNAPAMLSVKEVENHGQWYDFSTQWKRGIYVLGGAQVDGVQLRKALIQKAQTKGVTFKAERAVITENEHGKRVNGNYYDKIVIATGPWINETLSTYTKDRFLITKQRGVLATFSLNQSQRAPVMMPSGEYDYLFRADGNLIVGATHENVENFSNNHDEEAYKEMITAAQCFIPTLKDQKIINKKIGYRAQSKNNIPFYGSMPNDDNVFVASGLGSSGLTTGPYIGYRLAKMISGEKIKSDDDYEPKNHLVQS